MKRQHSKSRTKGQHSFAQIPTANIQRSSFNRSCGVKTTFDASFLIPIFVDEALPGDTMSLRLNTFARLATPLHPVMDNMYLDYHFFAVPVRLVWDNWAKFNGEQTDPGDSVDFLVPIQTTDNITGAVAGSLTDYLGIPTEVPDLDHSALWHRAYNLIWNEWFRDENLQDSVVVDLDDGPDNDNDYTILRRGKRHDYFTSCLPFPQKGPAVELPLGTSAPVVTTIDAAQVFDIDANGDPSFIVNAVSRNLASPSSGASANWDTASGTDTSVGWDVPALDVDIATAGATGTADLSAATSATINAIREAFQVQRLYERDARGGTRYTEIIRSHFGVTSPDQRLQRPEFLGGGTSPITLHPVEQTGPTGTSGSSTPQANLAAYGTSSYSGGGFTKSFVEHSLILGFASVRADLNYQQGLNRMFSRRTRWDFYWPTLAHLGEQAVLNKEIYAQGSLDPGVDDLVFGYQERFAEYRYKPSIITGQMRSNFTTPLDTWHLAQDFSTLPLLNSTFIEDNPPIDRIIAVPSEPHILFDAYFQYRCARPMPTYGVPGQIDHF